MSREAFEAFGKRKVFPNGGVSMEFVLAVPGLRESWDCWNEAWKSARAAALEEAAEVADAHATCEGIGQRIAVEIRALKEPQ